MEDRGDVHVQPAGLFNQVLVTDSFGDSEKIDVATPGYCFSEGKLTVRTRIDMAYHSLVDAIAKKFFVGVDQARSKSAHGCYELEW